MNKRVAVVVAIVLIGAVVAQGRDEGDQKKSASRAGTVAFQDGKSRDFTSIIGLTIPPQENALKRVENGDLLLQGRQNDVVIPWDKISSLSIKKGKFHPTVEIVTTEGKKETFDEVTSGVEIEWVDSVARSRLSIHDKLLGATIQFRKTK